MVKYTYELKLHIVQSYLESQGGYQFLAKKYNIKSFEEEFL
ncbi:transposase [Lactococcus lactis]|nr:transposase [Lactococcus lactis]